MLEREKSPTNLKNSLFLESAKGPIGNLCFNVWIVSLEEIENVDYLVDKLGFLKGIRVGIQYKEEIIYYQLISDSNVAINHSISKKQW